MSLRERIVAALASHEPSAIPDDRCDVRAAVALVLRAALPEDEGRASGRGAARPEGTGGRGTAGTAELLFVQRAEVDRDPWSGHMALPGGRKGAEDPDLLATALRETREETSLPLREEDVLGRLDDVHPLSRRLPSIAVTPYVAWYEGRTPVRGNHEVRDHVWIPLPVLTGPGHRSTFRLERGRGTVTFPTIEYEAYTIWGLTFEIVAGFLRILQGRPPGTGPVGGG